jgi:hypothetical protein
VSVRLGRSWPLMYERPTRSMLQTDQHLPDLANQTGTVETNPDGSTDIYFGFTPPEGKSNQSRSCALPPFQPFFDKSWRPSAIDRWPRRGWHRSPAP